MTSSSPFLKKQFLTVTALRLITMAILDIDNFLIYIIV